MIYLKDEATGVTVEDAGYEDRVSIEAPNGNSEALWLTGGQASAVLLGLSLRAESKGDWSHVEAGLRRMLEKEGSHVVYDLLLKIVPDMLSEGWR